MAHSRRVLTLIFSIIGLLGPLVGASSALHQTEPATFRWHVPIAHLHVVKGNLQFQGSVTAEEDTKGVPLGFVFAGLALLPNLADAVLALRREIVHGGVVIDTRGKEVKIANDPRLDGGVMIVISKEGTRLYERDELWDPAELVHAIDSGFLSSSQVGRGCSMGKPN